MRSEEETPIDLVIQRLNLLILFHLGADAESTSKITVEGLTVSMRHSRIEPFQLKIPAGELKDLAAQPERLEERFLDLLVKHRRG